MGTRDAASPTHGATGDAIASLRFDNMALSVADAEASAAWYARHFGFAVARRMRFEPVGADVVFLEREGVRLELLQVATSRRTAALDAEPSAHLGYLGYKAVVFTVVDLDAFTDALEVNGANVVWALQALEPDGPRSTLVRDPDGNLINVFERTSA